MIASNSTQHGLISMELVNAPSCRPAPSPRTTRPPRQHPVPAAKDQRTNLAHVCPRDAAFSGYSHGPVRPIHALETSIPCTRFANCPFVCNAHSRLGWFNCCYPGNGCRQLAKEMSRLNVEGCPTICAYSVKAFDVKGFTKDSILSCRR